MGFCFSTILSYLCSNADTDEFNKDISELGPEDEDSRAYFEEVRQKAAPDYPDWR